MSDTLKIGIVGCGLIAGLTHIPIFKRLEGRVVLAAVCDKNENLAKETISKFKIPHAYNNLSQMLSNEDLDVIDICTPPQTHPAIAIEALEQDCHVMMEKPMALTSSDCDQMIGASQRHGVKLCVIHNLLFDPPLLRAKELVADSAFGDFLGLRILMSDPRE